MKLRIATGAAISTIFALFVLLAPSSAAAYGSCPGVIAQDAFVAAHPELTVLPLASLGTINIFVGGDTSSILPYGIICDTTHDVGAVRGQAGNFGGFSPIDSTGGNPYFGQTAGDIFALIFSDDPRSNFGSNTAVLFFMADSSGFVQPTSLPPNVLAPVSITSSNASTTLAKVGDTVTLTFTSDSDVLTPVVTIGTHSAAVATTTSNSFTASTTLDASDADGAVPFTIKLTNYFGNVGLTTSTTSDNSAVSFDQTAPTITITSGPAGGSVSTSSPTTFAFTVDSDATTSCAFDGAATSSCSGSVSQALVDGIHTFSIVAADQVGNTTSTTTAFTIDTTPPTLSITDGPANGATIATSSVSFTFSSDASAILCSYDGAATSTCTSPFATTSADGAHTFVLSATDDNGNSSYLLRAFTIDTIVPAPVVANNGGGNGPPVQNSTQSTVTTPVVAANTNTPAPTTPATPAAEVAGVQTSPAPAPTSSVYVPGVTQTQTAVIPTAPAETPAPTTDVTAPTQTTADLGAAAVTATKSPAISPWYLLALPAGFALWWFGRKFIGVK